ncbi:Maf-like protein [Gossypium arboreum]|uniref:Maf-like protein n=1 Tax=Gossypium arboreum TaxID=29729 RepID=A0A0B0NA14_GOSAR|nr:Maf-like protein [Gossypium arboreum]
MARQRILAEMGYEFTIMTADIDEKSIRKEKPEDLVTALAEAKLKFGPVPQHEANAIMARLQHTDILKNVACPTLLITADTLNSPIPELVCLISGKGSNAEDLSNADLCGLFMQVVVYKGTIREKPCNEDEAREFIKGYSGGHAAVVGSVLVTNLNSGASKGGWESAEVYFHDIPNEVIDSLIDEGIPFKVAGGLMLEHPLTLPFVDAVIGATDTVMGLSKSLTEKLIEEALCQPGSSPRVQNMS